MVHNLCKRGAFYRPCLQSNFCFTNQVFLSICFGNFNSSILANVVLLCSRSWIVHNSRKREAFYLSYTPSKFYVTNQKLLSIGIQYLNYAILANFVLLHFRVWTIHNLCKKRAFWISPLKSKFCVKNQVLLSTSLRNFNSPVLANFVLLRSQSWIAHNLRKRGAFWLPY